MVVVPQAEKQSKQNENRDDRELPAAAEKNKETSEGDPRGRSQKQDRAHAEPLSDQDRSNGKGDKKRDRNKRHQTNADDRSGFELAHVPDMLRAHGADKEAA